MSLESLSIKVKLSAILVASILMISFLSIHSLVEAKDNLIKERQNVIKTIIRMAENDANKKIEQVRQGKLTLEEAKEK